MLRVSLSLVALLGFAGIGYGVWSSAASALAPHMELYAAHVTSGELAEVRSNGFDVAVAEPAGAGYDILLVLTRRQHRAIEAMGVRTTAWRDEKGRSTAQLARLAQENPASVWRPYDGENGIHAELLQLAADRPDLVALQVIGHSVQGREILAAKVTANAGEVQDGARAAVLYSSLQHAREWIGLEVNRRLLYHIVNGYATDGEIQDLLNSRELWFVLVANPDGYQFSHERVRLWRKNLRDNNGDGVIDGDNDGVDPNRNFDSHWGYDAEGADLNPGGTTYRGSGPASEPETQAMQGLLRRVPFVFQVNYHSAAELLLYPLGWQDQTPSVDHPIFAALSGTPANSAVPGSRPILSAGLYITNGETCDFAYDTAKTLCWTPELTDAGSGGGFIFPDDDALVQAEFLNNLPFAMDVARSATGPTEPSSHLGNTAAPMVPTTFSLSYGDPQIVEVNAQRLLGDVTLQWRLNDGPEQSAPTQEWAGGERYGVAGSVHYHKLRGQVAGASPGDIVTVWFRSEAAASEPFTYTLASDTGAPVLVVAAEDYTGILPEYQKTDGPTYLEAYLQALETAELAADVYDVDARGRLAPSALGVLSHYEAIVWYTGDDQAPRAVGRPNGTADLWANDLQLAVRDYLNEGGKLLFTGKYAGTPYFSRYAVSPDPANPCDPGNRTGTCQSLVNDFLQYYLSAYTNLDNAGTASGSGLVRGVRPADDGPFAGLELAIGGPEAANNQDHSMGLMHTSRYLPEEEYPQFASRRAAFYDNPDLAPHSGERYLYSGYTSGVYQRLARTVDLTSAITATLRFSYSLSTANNRGFLLVEAHTVGQDNWTTLRDLGGRTSQTLPNTCPHLATHPHLSHYLTQQGTPGNAGAACLSTGTSGAWHAVTGNSNGWQPFTADLAAFLGQEVEVVISHVTNITRLGYFLDDVALRVDDQVWATSFEEDLDGWALAGVPDGSPANVMELTRTDASAVPVSAAITTADTVYLGFGFEAIATAKMRAELMCRAMDHLLGNTLPCAGHVRPPPPLYLPWSHAR